MLESRRRSALQLALVPVLVCSMLGLAACADYGGPISGSTDQALSPQERRLQAVENKTTQLLRRLDAMNSDGGNSQSLSSLQNELRELRGETEKLRFEMTKQERSQRELFANLDRRLSQLEASGSSASAGAGASAGSSMFGGDGGSPVSGTVPSSTPGTLTSSAAVQKATVATPEEERAYLGTFDLLKNGKYDESITGFRAMLQQWPAGRYADNGWYWMGEAQLVKRDYSEAAKSFEALVRSFPDSPKVADGLYKLGLCQAELKRSSEAKLTLQRVIREHPNSNAANLAKRKLDQLGG